MIRTSRGAVQTNIKSNPTDIQLCEASQICKRHQEPKSRRCCNSDQCPILGSSSRESLWPNHTSGETKTLQRSAKKQTVRAATPQSSLSYSPPPGKLERPGTFTTLNQKSLRNRQQNKWKSRHIPHFCLPIWEWRLQT